MKIADSSLPTDEQVVLALSEFMNECHQRETSPAGQRSLAAHGDIQAARAVLKDARDALIDARLVGRTSDDRDLAITTGRLLGRMLEQPDAAIRKAFGFSRGRQHPDELLRSRIVWFAVENCMFGMGQVRAKEEACALVAQATAKTLSVFPKALTEENIAKIYSRQTESDPLGDSYLE